MIRVTDDLGRELYFDRCPQRIVSLVPSLTETICKLGRGSLLVGVTRHCTEPADELDNAARVGGTKTPDLRRIAGLAPDVVLFNIEENRKQDFEELDRCGLAAFATFPRTVADVPGLLRRLGELLNANNTAGAAALQLDGAIATARSARPSTPVSVFCPIWKNPWMTFGRDTFADNLLELVGGRNVFQDEAERYFEISLGEVVLRQPSAILLPDEPYVFAQKDLAALAPLAETQALQEQRVYFVDGKALFWFGTRTAAALGYLRALLHPRPLG